MQCGVWKAPKQECGTPKRTVIFSCSLGQASGEVWKRSHPVKTHILSSDVADTALHGPKYENIFK